MAAKRVGGRTDQAERRPVRASRSGLASLVGRFPDGDELADALDEIVAARAVGRDVPEPDRRMP
jgi:hypothetical protein